MLALGGLTDNSIQLTTAWSVFASYEHFWTPALRTDLYGSYLSVRYNATANMMMCAGYATTMRVWILRLLVAI